MSFSKPIPCSTKEGAVLLEHEHFFNLLDIGQAICSIKKIRFEISLQDVYSWFVLWLSDVPCRSDFIRLYFSFYIKLVEPTHNNKALTWNKAIYKLYSDLPFVNRWSLLNIKTIFQFHHCSDQILNFFFLKMFFHLSITIYFCQFLKEIKYTLMIVNWNPSFKYVKSKGYLSNVV